MIGDFLRRQAFMRDHRWTRSHMSPYIDRELDSRDRARVERHTEICPECRRALAALRRTVQALRRLGIDEGAIAPSGAAGQRRTAGPVAERVIGYLRRTG